MESAATQPPPVDPEPRWPAWYAITGFLTGVMATFLVVGIAAAATGTSPDEESATFTTLATLLQSVIFVATAVLFASFTAPPRPWQFGLRRTRLWPAVGWAALGMFAFYVFAAIYTAAVQPDAEQRVTESLGADESTLGLIAAGILVIAIAPVAEEFFFRGFFYTALRTRFPVVTAALIDAVLFGVIHYDFSGLDMLLLVPPLGVLGFVFCLVYERTGSILPVIALHALNNSVAYGVQAEAWEVSVVLGPLMIASCIAAPRVFAPLRVAPALR
jgi:uncharacterized protein